MAFNVKSKKSGKTYFLHSKEVTLRGDRQQKIYYFAGKAGKDAVDKLPAGYEVIENNKTGLPMLRKAGAKKK
jgi:YHS domain-containing protein